jgi:hypothetical protein
MRCVGVRAEEKRHRGLKGGGSEAARDVEGEVAEAAERVLDVLAEDREEEHVADEVIPASVHEHRGEPAENPRQGRLACVRHVAGVEGRLLDRASEVRELVEDPDGEVRRDQRTGHDREAACWQPVGERQHRSSSVRMRWPASWRRRCVPALPCNCQRVARRCRGRRTPRGRRGGGGGSSGSGRTLDGSEMAAPPTRLPCIDTRRR